MEQSTLAIIILAIVGILYMTEKIPILLTTLFAMLAMSLTGILTYAQSFSGMGSTAVMMVLGMGIIGQTFFSTGLAEKMGEQLYKYTRIDEKKFVLIACVLASLLAIVINAMAVVMIFMPIVNSVVKKSNGTITRRAVYLPMAIAAIYGGGLSAVSWTAMITASGLLNNSSAGRGFTMFEPSAIMGPVVLVFLIFLLTLYYPLQKHCFTFEEPPISGDVGDKKIVCHGWKPWLLVGVLVLCVIGFVFTKINVGGIALLAAGVLMLTNCIDTKTAFKNADWGTIFIVGGAIGFAQGIEKSGAGEVLARLLIDSLGLVGQSPFGMCIAMLVLTTFISNFMSNNAAVVIVAPIAIAAATQMHSSVVAYVLATAIGAGLSVATPICNASITVTLSAGYRVKDLLKIGGFVNFISTIGASIALYLVYFQ